MISARRTHQVSIRLSEGFSPSGFFAPTFVDREETYTVQSPKPPKKGAKRQFVGYMGEKISKAKETFTTRHQGPGAVLIDACKDTSWLGPKGFAQLKFPQKLEVKARFDGKRWIALRIEEVKEGADDP